MCALPRTGGSDETRFVIGLQPLRSFLPLGSLALGSAGLAMWRQTAWAAASLCLSKSEGIEDLFNESATARRQGHDAMKDQFYGMREFVFEDPEGWVIALAQRINT